MTTPGVPTTTERRHGFYQYQWGETLTINVDRFHETGRSLYAEVMARHNGRHILRTTKDLLSDTAKATLARRLAEMTGDPTITWEQVVEYVCESSIRAYRLGEPVTEIGNRPLRTTPAWRLYPILPERLPSMLFGAGGSLKSYLALAMAMCVQGGVPLLGWQPTQGNVLYLDWEMSADETNERLLRLQAGLQLPAEAAVIRYKRCDRSLADLVPELLEEVAANDIVMVVVDSAIAATGGDPNKPEVVNEVFTALRQLDVSALLISHVSGEHMEGDKKHKRPFSSVFWENWCRHIFEVRASEEEANPRPVALFNTKSNMTGRLQPLGYQVSFDEEAGDITITRQDVLSVPEFGDRIPLSIRIRAALGHGRKTWQQLAEDTGAKPGTIQKTLSQMKARGGVQNWPDGWGLVSLYEP